MSTFRKFGYLGALAVFFSALLFASPALALGNLGLSELSISLSPGQETTITASDGYVLSLGSNSNAAVATASISGNYNQLIVNALSAGTTDINICNPNNLCDMLVVTVGASTPLSLSQTNVTLAQGQNQTITISGIGGNTLQSNSNPSSVNAVVNGSSLVVSGSAYGGSNINVCQSDGQCAMAYVFVNGAPTSSSQQPSLSPLLSSVDISSSDVNNSFIGAESAITISFSVTQPITNTYVTIAGSRMLAEGSGTGPYTVTYSATGSEPSPLPVSISFNDQNGNPTQVTLSVGIVTTITNTTSSIAGCLPGASFSSTTGASCGTASTVSPAVPIAPVVSTPAAPTVIGDGYQFNNPLTIGATGLDVTELQKRLTAEGLYSGPITGYYGSLTEAAVQAYQAKIGVSQLGNVGPATRGALNSGI